MNRRYSARQFASIVERIHGAIPQAAVGVDVMAGFPGEDDRASRNTLALIEGLAVSYLHVFPFSPAARHPRSILRRSRAPGGDQAAGRGPEGTGAGPNGARFTHGASGRRVTALTEGWDGRKGCLAQATSDNYVPVTFPVLPGHQGRARTGPPGRGIRGPGRGGRVRRPGPLPGARTQVGIGSSCFTTPAIPAMVTSIEPCGECRCDSDSVVERLRPGDGMHGGMEVSSSRRSRTSGDVSVPIIHPL